ncbi:MAG: succinate dehydrogenase iron-sulfur subunit, partial [Thermodesulfovibrio sp.]
FRIKLNSMERVLDGLIKIKETRDGTLTFRKSCAHGVCGSCAMKINGKNRLACQTLVKDLPEVIEIEPLPSLPVIKDLVVDMTLFFEKNDKVLPYLINDEPAPERERIQSPEDQHKILESITCIMCGSCTTSCPVFWADKEYLGPSALLKAYRFIFDSRDRATEQRLEAITGEHGLWRCHSIFNCVEVCPKEIDITKHILKLKRQAVKKGFTGGEK